MIASAGENPIRRKGGLYYEYYKFDELKIMSRKWRKANKKVLIDFWAAWCGSLQNDRAGAGRNRSRAF